MLYAELATVKICNCQNYLDYSNVHCLHSILKLIMPFTAISILADTGCIRLNYFEKKIIPNENVAIVSAIVAVICCYPHKIYLYI